MINVVGGPHDGDTLDATVEIPTVPMSHIVDGELVGVAWYRYDRAADTLTFNRYEDYSFLGWMIGPTE